MVSKRQCTRGFLLIEVAVVVALVIVVIMLAVPHMSFLKKQIVYSEVEKLATVCLFLRQQALVTQHEQTLLFDQNNHTYASQDCIYRLCSGVRFGFLPKMYGPPSSPKSLIHQAITFHNQKISFYADGTMSSGTIYIVDAAGASCYAVTIPTGQVPFIRKYEYQQGWIQLS